jgi:hypothetical protein
MTAADISRIAITVGTVQLFCDLLAYWRIYSKDPYERAVDALSRAKWKRDKASEESVQLEKEGSGGAAASSNKKASKSDRQAKKLQRAEDDYGNAKASVARRHTLPGFFTSFLFIVMLRILGLEYKGNIVGVLPFAPFSVLSRVTSRSLAFTTSQFESDDEKVTDVSQACAFMFIYFLCTMSVKYYISHFFGTQPPHGAEGLMAIAQSPMGQKILRSAGIDPDELKMD